MFDFKNIPGRLERFSHSSVPGACVTHPSGEAFIGCTLVAADLRDFCCASPRLGRVKLQVVFSCVQLQKFTRAS